MIQIGLGRSHYIIIEKKPPHVSNIKPFLIIIFQMSSDALPEAPAAGSSQAASMVQPDMTLTQDTIQGQGFLSGTKRALVLKTCHISRH